MPTPLIAIVRQAREIGITLSQRPDKTLAIRTTKSADAVARALRARETEVLALYDWHSARVGESEPCILCGRGAFLRDPVDHRPCHKICADAVIRGLAAPTA